MKSEWEIRYIESSYGWRQRTFPPAVAEGKVAAGGKVLFQPLLREASTNARNVRFSFHFSTQKGLFHACVKKKFIFVHSRASKGESVDRRLEFRREN